jgi:hypothetical protein
MRFDCGAFVLPPFEFFRCVPNELWWGSPKETEMKQCSKCKEWKDEGEFSKQLSRKDGLPKKA